MRHTSDSAFHSELLSCSRERAKPPHQAPARRDIPHRSLPRQSSLSHHTRSRSRNLHQPQTAPKAEARNGLRSHLVQAPHQHTRPWTSQISLLTAGLKSHTPRSSLVHRHHLRSYAQRQRLPMRRDGLALEKSVRLGRIQHHRNRTMPRSVRKCTQINRPNPRDL